MSHILIHFFLIVSKLKCIVHGFHEIIEYLFVFILSGKIPGMDPRFGKG